MAAQVRAFIAEEGASDLDELPTDALRRLIESHKAALTEVFLKEDLEWGLHGDDGDRATVTGGSPRDPRDPTRTA